MKAFSTISCWILYSWVRMDTIQTCHSNTLLTSCANSCRHYVVNTSHGKIVCILLQSEITVDKSAASLLYENLAGCWGWTPKDRIYSLWCVYMIFLAYFNAGTQTSWSGFPSLCLNVSECIIVAWLRERNCYLNSNLFYRPHYSSHHL